MATEQLGIVVRTFDEATATLKQIDSRIQKLEKSGKKAADSLSRMDKVIGNMRGRIRAAFEFHVVNRGLMLMEQGLRKVANAIPDLISKGEKWAATVDEIADVTGLAAEKASELAAIQGYLNDGTDSLGRALMVLSKNAVTNKKAFDQLGIATRDSNGRMLDAYEIIGNVRQRLAATGTGLLTTTAAQKVFGRGAHDLLDLLTLTNEQWAIYSESARRSGLILTEAGLQAADQWTRTKRILDGALTGLGSQVLNNVAPVLVRLVNGITKVIQDNMDAIVTFVAKAVTFIAQLVGGLLGIDFQMASIVERVADAGDTIGDASLRQRDFRDRTKEATDETDKGNAALAARRRMLRAIEKAEWDLRRARAAVTFGGDKSRLEVELARQARIARIREAQERVAEARKALNERRSDASEYVRIAANAAEAAGIRWKGVFGKGGKVPTIIGTGLTDALAQATADAARAGSDFANAIKDAIFGPESSGALSPQGTVVGASRSGGLVDKITGLVDALAGLGKHFDNLNNLLGGNGPLVLGLAALVKLIPGGEALLGLGAKAAWGGLKGPGRTGGGSIGLRGGSLGGSGLSSILRLLPAALMGIGSQVGPDNPILKRMIAKDPDAYARWMNRTGQGGLQNDYVSSGSFDVDTPESRARHARFALLQNEARKSMPWLHRSTSTDTGVSGPGLSLAEEKAGGSKLAGLTTYLRRYWGAGSALVTTQQDIADAADWTAVNTMPLIDGGLTASIDGWTDGVEAAVTGNVGILSTANTVSLGPTTVGVTGNVGILTKQNTVTVGNDTVNVGGNVGLLATKNTVTVGNQTLNVGGSVGILAQDNRVSLGNTAVNVKGDVGLLSGQNTVHVGNQTLSVGGNVGLLQNSNTVNVGGGSLTVGGNVGLVSNSNTIKLGAVEGGVVISVAGNVALVPVQTALLVSISASTAATNASFVTANSHLYSISQHAYFTYWQQVTSNHWLSSIAQNMKVVATWADKMYGYMGQFGLTTYSNHGAVGVYGFGPGNKVPVVGDFQGDVTVPSKITVGDWQAGTLGTNVWNRPNVNVANRPNVDVANKPSVEIGRWDPWSSGMYVMQAGVQGYLRNIWEEGNRTAYATFATGTSYVPQTGMALIHKGEMVIPAKMSDAIRRNEANLGGRAGGFGQQAVNVVVQIGDKTIARALGIVSGSTTSIRVQPAI